MKIDFWAGLASIREISKVHNLVCLAGIPNKTFALGDLPFYNHVDYMVDSGAFQDVDKNKRLSFSDALERQKTIIKAVSYPPKSIVTYDFLVDEKYENGRKIKQRVSWEASKHYVSETIKAAEYYSQNRIKDVSLIISAQGINPEQYYECSEKVLNFAEEGDIFGFGGFCILGKVKKLVPSALLTFQKVLPLVKEKGIKKVHIFGVTYLDFLYILSKMCDRVDLGCQTDSTAMSRTARFGQLLNKETGQRIYVDGKADELGPQNVLNLQYILDDINNRYYYKGKKGWLLACDFNYKDLTQEELF